MAPWSPALADLQTTADLCRLFGDPTRLRLLALVDQLARSPERLNAMATAARGAAMSAGAPS